MKVVYVRLPEKLSYVKNITYKGIKYINLNWIPQADGKTKFEKL
jgi:hypothetical protein